jgi:hypothetical protein
MLVFLQSLFLVAFASLTSAAEAQSGGVDISEPTTGVDISELTLREIALARYGKLVSCCH